MAQTIESMFSGARAKGALAFRDHLPVGSTAPECALFRLDGSPVRLSEYIGRKHLVLHFGSVTTPASIDQLPAMERVRQECSNNDLEFIFIYVRDPHPGSNYPQPATLEERLWHARALQREEAVSWVVLVDGITNECYTAFGSAPAMAYVITREGLVFYKTNWVRASEVKEALQDLLYADRAPSLTEDEVLPRFTEKLCTFTVPVETCARVLKRAGQDSIDDLQRAFNYKAWTLRLTK